MTEYHGHLTMLDGTHVPLTKDDAAALMRGIEEANAKRAQDMPTSRDALSALIRAESRLNDLGWRKGGGLRVQRGDNCAVAETGSTGMWSGRLDAEGRYVHYGDCASDRQKLWLKPLADLSEDERAWLVECDKREAEAFTHMMNRLAGGSDD